MLNINERMKQDIEKMGGSLFGKPDGLISNFTFKSAKKTSDCDLELTKKYPTCDFFTRGRRLLVYGIIS